MFKYRLCIISLLLAGLLLGGCASSRPGENQKNTPIKEKQPVKQVVLTPGDYFPLKAGSSWTYKGQGFENASFERQVEYVKNNYAQVREANGATVSLSIYQTTNKAVTRAFFRGEFYDNVNMLEKSFTANDNTIILQAPLQKGKVWKSDDKTNREIVSLEAKVEAPAGKFENCLQIKMNGPDYVINEYYGKGIGLIKREFISGGETISSTLQKYTIGK